MRTDQRHAGINDLIFQVQIHRGETSKIRLRVEDLEYTNLEMMSKLFDCTVEDLKVSR